MVTKQAIKTSEFPYQSSITRRDLNLIELISQHQTSFKTTIGSRSASCAFKGIEQVQAIETPHILTIDIDGRCIEIIGSRTSFQGLSPSYPFDELSISAQMLALEYALDIPLIATESITKTPICFVSFQNKTNFKSGLSWDIYFEDGASSSFLLCGDMLSLKHILKFFPQQTTQSNDFPDLNLTASVLLDDVTLTVEEISNLEKGDVILANNLSRNKVIVEVSQWRRWRGQLSSNKVEFLTTDSFPVKEEKMKKDTVQGSINTIPVTVKFEVAQIDITLSELRSLKPGKTVVLPSTIEDPINLMVNGECIGVGTLIKIGDAVGVQIQNIT